MSALSQQEMDTMANAFAVTREAIVDSMEVFRKAYKAVGEAMLAFAPVVVFAWGYKTGEEGGERDWTMPDEWHRGYLRGKLLHHRKVMQQ